MLKLLNKPGWQAAARRLSVTLLAIALPMGAVAEGDARANRDREQLRRSQAALQAAQSKADALEADKAGLLKDKEAQAKEAQGQRARAGALQRQSEQATAEVAQLRKELAEATGRQKQAQAEAEARDTQAQQQLAAARRENHELRQANVTLSALLENSSRQLTQAEAQNRELYSLSHQALDRWINKTAAEAAMQQEPALGLSKVRMQDSYETFRARIDAQRLTPTAPQGGQ
ncbi:hypothetical protein [Roseateles koreensis]|uniref:Uncharacterized protein n=1 Tax=Roseateles koreensis TaxID=2987526 RepID=A0ABT5KQ98_9BURK|nr:hypothetical protein [Roseateles koreensis]MDC8784041.1 hypothetical protein [Roseateles koreensis]